MRRKMTFVVALAAALVAAMVFGAASAQEMMNSTTLQLTPSRDSGTSGTAILTDTGSGVEVQLDVQGLPSADGTEHVAHIHEGATCTDDRAGNGAPVEFPLTSIVSQGGAGSSTSTIEDSLAELTADVPHYVNVHAEATDDGSTPPGIACADIVLSDMPSTGGFVSPMTLLLLGGAAVVLMGATTGFIVRRRAYSVSQKG